MPVPDTSPISDQRWQSQLLLSSHRHSSPGKVPAVQYVPGLCKVGDGRLHACPILGSCALQDRLSQTICQICRPTQSVLRL